MGRRFHYDKFYVSICASESDEQSYDECDEFEDSDDSEDESCYDLDEDDEDEEYFSYSGEDEEEEIEELVVLARVKTKRKRGGASTSTTILSRKRKSCATKRERSSKISAKKNVLKTPLKKKISKSKKGSLIRRDGSGRKKPAAATRNTKKDKEKAETIMRSMASYSNNKKEDLENRPMTFLVFDLETTGLSRIHHRIIEIALVDPFHGGENNTFHSLVNPDCPVPNSHIHHITTKMVSKPGVPRMHELIPMLVQFVKSHQKPRGYVVLVAHNARCFDVPFLVNEFKRCSKRIPSNWLFLDTLPLARQLMKSQDVVGASNLEALREHYGITLVGSAHRAMADVDTLSQVLQRIAFDLNLSTADLVQKTFTVRDLTLSKAKKNTKKKKKISS